MIQSTSKILLSQIKFLLDKNMLDMNAFTPQLEIISLKKILQDAVTISSGQAHLRSIKLNRKFKGSDIELQIDKMRTIQILLNLISNAIKFSPDNGEIDVECN